MDNQFNFKDFEKVRIKATYNIEIGDKKIEEGETIALFDKIQIAGIDAAAGYITAHGGYEDRDRVFWETKNDQQINFAQGVFSKEQFALLTNSLLLEKAEGEGIEITYDEILESDENSQIELKYTPIGGIHLYDFGTKEKITSYTIEDNVITLSAPYQKVIIDYIFDYQGEGSLYRLGNKLITGFVSLEGRTRVKDDITGHIVTGIIKIPRLKLMSNLSIRLGANATPMVGRFSGIATPVGSRGSTYVSEFYILSDDIDSDL